jgi:hypothetical protein
LPSRNLLKIDERDKRNGSEIQSAAKITMCFNGEWI